MLSKAKVLDLAQMEKRIGSRMFNRVRYSVGLSLRHSRKYFPAYRFLVNEFINDEWLAMVDWHKFHRDHVIHQPMSVYVGMSLLNGGNPNGSNHGILFREKKLIKLCIDAIFDSPKSAYLREYLKEMGAPRIYIDDTPVARLLWKWLFLDTFFLAVLFHDIGYPWRFVNVIHEKLELDPAAQNPSLLGIEWITRNYCKRLVFYPANGYKKRELTEPAYWPEHFMNLLKKGLFKTHGVPGAIALLHLSDLLRKYPDDKEDKPVRRFCIEWAAMAVMMHDLGGLFGETEKGQTDRMVRKQDHLRNSLNRDPLSFVLTLTDQLQDFDRPDAEFRSTGTNSSSAIYRSRCQGVRVQEENGIMTVTYQFRNRGDYMNHKHDYLPKNERLYFHPHEGYLDYSGLGLTGIRLDAELI